MVFAQCLALALLDIFTHLWMQLRSYSLIQEQLRATRTVAERVCVSVRAPSAPRLSAGDADVFIGLPFFRRWWISLGFPVWKRSIQLISGCNCTPEGAAALGALSSTPTFGLCVERRMHCWVGEQDRSIKQNRQLVRCCSLLPLPRQSPNFKDFSRIVAVGAV